MDQDQSNYVKAAEKYIDPQNEVKDDENEEDGISSVWQYPYFLYIFLTVGIFVVLIGIAFFARSNGWIPVRD